MVRLQLKCLHGDYFDAWFGDRAAFTAQRHRGQVGCPVCGETDVVEATPLKPGLYPDLNEDQARQMACDTRRMLENWIGRGVLEIAGCSLAAEAARVMPAESEVTPADRDSDAEPAVRTTQRHAPPEPVQPSVRAFAYDC